MPQIKRSYQETRIPFEKMSYTPDIPSTNLGANEYNDGFNVESDTRGIRSVAGDQEWGPAVPSGETPVYVTSGYRQDGLYYYIVATLEGHWWATDGTNSWREITPTGFSATYVRDQNITDAWNGTVVFFNDSANSPMFWPEPATLVTTGASSTAGTSTLTFSAQLIPPYQVGDEIEVAGLVPTGFNGTHTVTGCTTTSVSFAGTTVGPQTTAGRIVSRFPRMTRYSNTVPVGITNILYVSPTEQQVVFDTPYPTAPYVLNDTVIISDVNNFFNGVYRVLSSTTATVNIEASPGAVYPGFGVGTISPQFCWNFNPEWSSVYARWLRLYNTPNVGSILVAGNLGATYTDGRTENFPVTVQWSQNFGLNQAPQTWEPTVLNVANQLEVPLRGESLDAFPCNGNLFISSYWDTVVLSPINYTTTNTPILGVRLFSQGRGLLTTNCWATTDRYVYGIDARDVWRFDGQNFTNLGNQRVRNWLFNEINPLHVDNTFLTINTQRNQVEIYYCGVITNPSAVLAGPTSGSFYGNNGILPQVGYRVIITGTNTGTGTISGYTSGNSYYITEVLESPYSGQFAGRSGFRLSTTQDGTPITTTEGSLTGLTFTFTTDGSPNRMLSYRFDLDVWNAPRDAYNANQATESPRRQAQVGNYWPFDPASRTVMYCRSVPASKLVETQVGYSFIRSSQIRSVFRRTNIKLLNDYSGKMLVHRILPEVVNITDRGEVVSAGTTANPAVSPLLGTVFLQVDYSSAVGAPIEDTSSISLATNSTSPWVQFNQNAQRVSSLEIGNTSGQNIWFCSATTWQYTPTEDDR